MYLHIERVHLQKKAHTRVCIHVGPSVEQIEMASAWAAQRVEEGYSVLVHCAHGHGRSATVMGAILIRQGIADSVDDAEKIMKKSRPRVRLNARQRKGLGAWYVRFYAKRR